MHLLREGFRMKLVKVAPASQQEAHASQPLICLIVGCESCFKGC